MNKNILLIIFLLVLFYISCQQNNNFNGYKDILINSPLLLWDSSIDIVKGKYKNIFEIENSKFSDDEIIVFKENELKEGIYYRYFLFLNNKLYKVVVGYGIYDNEMLNLLKMNIDKKHGIYQIENNDYFEKWDINFIENTKLNLQIHKLYKDYNIVKIEYINNFIKDIYPLKYKTMATAYNKR